MPRIGVYVCHCGSNIAGKVDVAEVARFAGALPDVAVARDYKFMCSDPGQALVQDDIRNLKLDRVVVASCSPLMHEATFRKACEGAGLNRYLFQMANIREHCSWVTEDPAAATHKAMSLVAAAVAKASRLAPLEVRKVPVNQNALVVGAGIAGIQAALDIAESGRTVFLVEKEPSIGGHMARFDKTFPTLDCAACILTPRMVQAGKHENIVLLPGATVEQVTGWLGNFKVRVRQRARRVRMDRCTSCGECARVCPVELPSEFEEGMTTRKAIYRSFPQAVPSTYVIDHRRTPPCKAACPIGQDVQGYLALVAAGKLWEAERLIRRTNPLPGICGRVCYHRCEASCSRQYVDEPLAIRPIKRFVMEASEGPTLDASACAPRNGKRVAIVGSGPAGLAAAHDLALAGYEVTIFEAAPEPGGMLRFGIPPFRLPREVLDSDIAAILKLGVTLRRNSPVTATGLRAMLGEHAAVFLATGAHKGVRLGLEGESVAGVVPGVEFLRRANLGQLGQVCGRVLVVGGGNTAMDAARMAVRLGADSVEVLYRRSRDEMPADPEEVEALEEEGIPIRFLVAPTRIVTRDGRLSALEVQRMRLSEPDSSGRRRPVPIPDSSFTLPCDLLIPAISQQPDRALLDGVGAEVAAQGTVVVDPLTMATSIPGLFAGGDVVRGPATVVEAMADGKRAARAIRNRAEGRPLADGLEPPAAPIPLTEEEKAAFRQRHPRAARARMPKRDPAERRRSTAEVELGFDATTAAAEARRCLNCGGCSECRECERVCEARAIDHDMKEEVRELEVGAAIIATGFRSFDARKAAPYGYGKFPDVYTALEFERMNSASGLTGGEIRCRDGRKPQSVGIIHCVGSRDERFNRHCSRVCCMYALKFAHLIKDKTGAEVFNFYIDMRCFGRGYEEFYHRLLAEDVRFIRGRAASVSDFPLNDTEVGKLVIRVEDTLIGEVRRIPVDMVILATGLEAREDAAEVARTFNISRGKDGFFLERHPKLAPVSTPTDGIFIAGACQGPKDIPDTVAQASGAAAQVLSLMARGEVEVEAATSTVDPERCAGCRICNTLCSLSAITFDPEKKVSVINDVLCKGCGTCAAACPSAAITARHFTDDQMLAEIEGVLHDVRA